MALALPASCEKIGMWFRYETHLSALDIYILAYCMISTKCNFGLHSAGLDRVKTILILVLF
jgi:hypothetical protein